MPFHVFRVACLTVLAAGLLTVAAREAEAEAGRTMVKTANSWSYQLQGDVSHIAASKADMVVIDPDHAGAATRFNTKPGGGRRAVLAYLSIGEAERGRAYWKSCCARRSPSWLTTQTQGWADNYVVRFWEPAWKAIVAARVKRFLAMGYDGFYLDRADSYESIAAPGGSRAAMVAFVREIAADARRIKADAAIVVQNAEELLTSDSYLEAIDGIAKEDLFHGANHSGDRNPGDMVSASVRLLKRAKAKGKSIFVVEYLSGARTVRVGQEIRAQGFVPNFAGRSLAN
jgi:uncharacterized protein (TIGR01370 family)